MQAWQEPGTAWGQAEDLQRGGDGGEVLVESRTKSGGRALAANVLWLDANPDARQELAQASPGAVSPKRNRGAILHERLGDVVDVTWHSCSCA